ncbi:MAG: family 10 glycosylhydrolase, partial [Gemmatirosa sp.]|nr:family 10 glycosylhydrolase [Gemmatirosa sp.]
QYGKMQWMDPGEPETMAHSLRVLRDVVQRYDVDGVHIDDYFYPYPETDAKGARIEFPDSASYAAYQRRGGTLGRDDWRRDNVDRFVHGMYDVVKHEKPWVKVGISPFGIWRPGEPAGACCFDAYKQLYADSRKWLRAGWADYFTPQLYWKISAAQQSYPALLAWWAKENVLGRNLWVGNYLSRVGEGPNAWPVAEIDSQIRLTRAQAGATGNVHFSMKPLMRVGGVGDSLAAGAYAEPALVPASPWLPGTAPRAPHVTLSRGASGAQVVAEMSPARGQRAPRLWVVRARYGATWTTDILPGSVGSYVVRPPATRGAPDEVRVSAVDLAGREGSATIVGAPASARSAAR